MKMSGMEQSVVGLITLAIIAGAFIWIQRDQLRFRRLVAVTAVTTLILIMLGAYVRLSDAGLGCPDWPGCYGNLTPHHSATEIRDAEAIQPGGSVTMAKAWKEMVHRYLAMIVGALIAAIMFAAWRNRRLWKQPIVLPTVIAAAVIFQAALGAWTVTLLLKPAIVTSHLIGGITILALLMWLLARQPMNGKWAEGIMASSALKSFAAVALIIVIAQVVLGGWVSTNYAALACADLPTCHGQLAPEMDFANAFHIIRPLGVGPDGSLLTLQALTAIHWAHRVGAVIVTLVLGSFAFSLMKVPSGKRASKMLLGLLVAQLLLGLSNVWFSLPLPVAVGHNGVAAMLVAWMVVINLRLRSKPIYN
jgi:heme a synthase